MAYEYLVEKLSNKINQTQSDVEKIANKFPDDVYSSPSPTATPLPDFMSATDYSLIPLNPLKAHFPLINHWDPVEWTALRHPKNGSTSPKGPEPIIVQFWEGPDGNVIPHAQRPQVTRDARAIWQDMHEKGKRLDTLTKIGWDLLQDFRTRMELLHPWLRLCAGHWKADQIWSNHFSSWWSDRKGKRPETLKREHSIEEDEAGPSQKKSKTSTDCSTRPKPTRKVTAKVSPPPIVSLCDY